MTCSSLPYPRLSFVIMEITCSPRNNVETNTYLPRSLASLPLPHVGTVDQMGYMLPYPPPPPCSPCQAGYQQSATISPACRAKIKKPMMSPARHTLTLGGATTSWSTIEVPTQDSPAQHLTKWSPPGQGEKKVVKGCKHRRDVVLQMPSES